MFALEWRLTLLTLLVLPAVHLPGAPARTAAADDHARGHAAERRDEQPHRRALQRRRRARRQAVRPARAPTATSSRGGRAACATSASAPRCTAASCSSRSGSSPRSAPRSSTSIGGNLAISGTLTAGTVAAFVLYVGQIYQPLAQLTNARVDVLTALVSFERVFEVLDFPPAIADRAGGRRARRRATGASSSTTSGSGTRRARRSRSRRSKAPARRVATSRATGSCATCRSRSSRARRSRSSDRPARARRRSRCSCRASTRSSRARCASTATTCATSRWTRCTPRSASSPQDPHLFHDTIRANLRFARPDATDAELEDALRAARIWDLVAVAPRRARHGRRRARLPHVGRREATPRDRARAARRTPRS